MKTTIALITATLATTLIAGCANPNGGGFFDPQAVDGNERYVTIWDRVGLPGNSEKYASMHCRQFGRIAQYQAMGGNAFQCAGRYQGQCVTYTCVQ